MKDSPATLNSRPLLAIVGATASGKNGLVQEVARQTNATLLSVDSRKIYRGLDIGTAKPSPELQREFDYAMIDCVDPAETYSAGRFAEDAREIVRTRRAEGREVILVGGTGFYLDAFRNGLADLPEIDSAIRESVISEAESSGWEQLYEELKRCDPFLAARTKSTDKTRILRGIETFRQTGQRLSEFQKNSEPTPAPWPMRVVCIDLPREELYQRVNDRVRLMVARGLFDEVENLLKSGVSPDSPGMQSVGYPESVRFLQNLTTEEETVETISRNTRRYAKRQLTWFRHREYVEVKVAQQVIIQELIDIIASDT
jgi:tRNA dimethylallyltransferase